MAEHPHPLEPLTGEEITTARAVLAEAGLVGERTRFPCLLPLEPPKQEVRAHREGDFVTRKVQAVLLDVGTGGCAEAVVDLAARRVESHAAVDTATAPYGQPAVLFEEYDRCAELVKADARWQKALARRGVERPDLAFVAPLSPGFFDHPRENGRRMLRALTFVRGDESDNPWAHPVEGLIADIDLVTGEVLRLEDRGDVPVPAERADYTAAMPAGLSPIEITQPEGPSFHVDGHHVTWAGWDFRIGFNAREGLTLHRIGFAEDGAAARPVIYRASVPEMVVPYGDPAPWRYWISYFDAGEYLLGKNANSLRLGCDCLGEIRYFDAVLADDTGNPVTIPHAVCMHEEDVGVLWKHTDIITGASEVRRARRLVVSFFTTVGNYDYGFFWYFYLDGTLELEVKATGIVFGAAAEPGSDSPYATEIAPGLQAPLHQHLFCARLDMDVAGEPNRVDEVDVVGIPTGPGNPHGNAFTTEATPLRRESEAARLADPARGRTWTVSAVDSRNRLGRKRGYQLVPHPGPALLAQPEATVHARAAFATKHLWVSRYDPGERFPAGDYPNQHAGGAGLPDWTAANRDLDGADLVLWHVFGPTHVPRPEDWPVMPVDRSGFLLRPVGFCDRNPTIPTGGHGDHHRCEH